MKKDRLLVVCIVIFVGSILFLTSCSQKTEGTKADSTSDMVAMLLDRYKDNEDYLALCTSDIDEKNLEKALKLHSDSGNYYYIVEDGTEIYKKLTGESPDLAAGEEIHGIYASASGSIVSTVGSAGYAIVAQGSKSGHYYIKAFDFGKV